jgi:hypothetical protein
MYGIVVCPRCKRAKGVELEKKTTACDCGFEIRVRSRRTPFETSDARELAAAVARVQAEIHGGTKAVEEAIPRPKKRGRDAFARVIADASRGDRRQRVRLAAEGLAREFILFTVEDWRRVAEAIGVPNPAEALEELVRGNVVYEPRPGYYRTV